MRSREEIEKIINAHKEGYTYNQIAKLFNANKSIIAFYCNTKRNRNIIERLRNEEQKNREYEELICEIVKELDNINQVCRKLNKRPTNNNYKKVNDIIKKYELDISHFTFENSFSKKIAYYSDDEVFSNRGKLYSSYGLKKKIV